MGGCGKRESCSTFCLHNRARQVFGSLERFERHILVYVPLASDAQVGKSLELHRVHPHQRAKVVQVFEYLVRV